MSTEVRRVLPADAAEFQALRLRGLREIPTAFGSSYEEECETPASDLAERLRRNINGFVLGAVEGGRLVGIVGMQREAHRKLAHKMILWGMYVAPEARGRGVGRQLVEAALREGVAVDGIL